MTTPERVRPVDWLISDLRRREHAALEKIAASKRTRQAGHEEHWRRERLNCRLMIWWLTEAKKHEHLWNLKVERQ